MKHLSVWSVTVLVAACASARPSPTTLQPVDSTTPPDLLNAVLARYARGAQLLIIDDQTTACMDMSLPQWRTLMDTLTAQAREAAADCARRSATRLRLRSEALRSSIPFVLQSARTGKPSLQRPLLFFSQAGFSADGSLAVIEVDMFCGGGLCGSDDMYWFRRTPAGWDLYAAWDLGVS
jgi:hypothetical protein